MKKLVTSYTFNAAAKTVVSSAFSSLENILLITNVTDNVIIYNFADPSKGGSLSGTTLTLTHDTTSMADADKLQVFVDDGNEPFGARTDAKSTATDTTSVSIVQLLKQISASSQISGSSLVNKHVSSAGTLVANTVLNSGSGVTLTQSGFTAVEVEITNVSGAAAIYVTLDGSTPSSTNFIAVLPATPSSVTLPSYNTSPTIKLISSSTPTWAATLRGS